MSFKVLIVLPIVALAMFSVVFSSSTHWNVQSYGSTKTDAGYQITGSDVTYVQGSWIVPAVHGCGYWPNKEASFWVGLDGSSGTTVEQIGTSSDCGWFGHGNYYAWYEMWPQGPAITIPHAIYPGDVMAASVYYKQVPYGNFLLVIGDVTQGWAFQTEQHTDHPGLTIAEWIIERGQTCFVNYCQTMALANFGTVQWGYSYTHIPNSANFATISGHGAPLAWYIQNSGNWSAYQLDMETTRILATPSNLTGDDSFTTAWDAPS